MTSRLFKFAKSFSLVFAMTAGILFPHTASAVGPTEVQMEKDKFSKCITQTFEQGQHDNFCGGYLIQKHKCGFEIPLDMDSEYIRTGLAQNVERYEQVDVIYRTIGSGCEAPFEQYKDPIQKNIKKVKITYDPKKIPDCKDFKEPAIIEMNNGTLTVTYGECPFTVGEQFWSFMKEHL